MSQSIPASSDGKLASEAGDQPVLVTKHRGLVMAGIIGVTLCQFLDATIANVALPHMRAALGASPDSISWVLTSFIIAAAITTPITGWLSDRIGSRRLFLGATTLFLISSALCGAANTLPAMVVFRAIQGVSVAFLGPMAQTTMFDISPPSKQPMALAIFSMIVILAPVTGPTLGGYLTEYLNWRWIYYVNIPIGIPALAILWWGLPSRPIERRKLDLFGFIAIGIGLGMTQLVLDRGQHKDWFNSWEIIVEAVIALSAFWVFLVHTRQTATPLFRPQLFRNPPFLFGVMSMMVMGVAVVGLSSVLPMLFQTIYGFPVIESGLMMAPRGVGVMITSLLCGVFISRIDYRWVITAGFLTAGFGMWSTTSWTLEMDRTLIYGAIFIQGLGMGMIISPLNIMAFSTLDPHLRPDGSSLLSLFRNLGGSVGISVIVTMLARGQQVSHADIGAHVTSSSVPGFDWPGAVDRLQGFGAAVMAMIDGEVNRQASMIAFLNDFYLLTWMLFIFAPLPFLLKKPVPTARPKPAPAAE